MNDDAIAVVGLAGRFPQASDVGEFWENLISGRECMTDLTAEEVLARGETPERVSHPSYVLRRPLLPGMEDFDAEFFGMTPREAELRDPQHRIFLEICHSAIEHAGYDTHRYDGAIGVYAGVNGNRYVDLHLRRRPGLVAAVGELTVETSNHPDYVTTFTSYKLNLRGPSMTIATACSSSLVALHQASQALRGGECDMALAGGVEVEWPYGFGYLHSPGGIYPPDGYCRPFDAAAAGTVFGSGAGAVLLKRYADAVADRDTIYALILGSAVNNDGADKVGFSAPSVRGQAACVAEALAAASVDPASVSYVEAHGTATKLGDPIEVNALTKAFRVLGPDLPAGYCGIGSVKSNIGHLGPASGVAGLIKTVLALHHETIPPSINFTEPSPGLDLAATPFTVISERTPWLRRPDAPRRAGVSSFGIGGTNAHAVLQEAPSPTLAVAEENSPRLLTLSARSLASLGRLRDDLAERLAWQPAHLADVERTLAVGRRQFEFRDTIVAASVEDAVADLTARRASETAPIHEVLLAFPGQGSQYAAMAKELHAHCTEFRVGFEACLADFGDLLELDLASIWRAAGSADDLSATLVAQPLLFSVSLTLAELLRKSGVQCSGVLGHSLGEITAATVAGVFTRDTAIEVVAQRARLMQDMPPGAMAAVSAAEADVAGFLGDDVSIAAVNAPQQVVLSGGEDALAAVLDQLNGRGIKATRLRTSHAYHSSLMSGAVEPFREVLDRARPVQPEIPFVSCATGQFEREACADPAFWAGQLVSPVRFASAATELLKRREGAVLLETGPGSVLSELAKVNPAVRRGRVSARPMLGRVGSSEAEPAVLLTVLGDLWRAGIDLDLSVFGDGAGHRVALPGHPLDRKRHYVDHPVSGLDPVPEAVASAAEPMVAEVAPADASPRIETEPALACVTWTRAAPPPRTDEPLVDALVFLPGNRSAAKEVLALVQRAGMRPVRVRPVGGDSSPDPAVDFDDRGQVLELIRGLAAEGRLPGTVIFGQLYGDAGAFEGPVAEQKVVLRELFWGVQAIRRNRTAGSGELRLVVLTRHGVDVTGGEPCVPAKAMARGFVRTLGLEIPELRHAVLDIGDRADIDTAVNALRSGAYPVAAIRGADVWVPAVRPVAPSDPDRAALRRRGVYLVTGASGGLGRISAEVLADTGLEPRIVLLARSITGLREFADELVARGAEVLTVESDVADEPSMRAALERIRREFGPVNGVLHAAGVAGDGFVELRTEAQIDAVLRPKLDGGLLLHRLLEAEPDLDFVLHYGSRAALTGLVGSGDYAAANAYLGALSARTTGGNRRVLAVHWPGWADVGMAARAAGNGDGGAVTADLTWSGAEWFLDEHRIAGEPVLPGTGYLDLVVSTAVRLGLVGADMAVALRQVVFATPLAVTPDTRVRVAFEPEGDRYRVAVRSRPAAGARWSLHCTAVLAPSDAAPENVDLGPVHDRLRRDGDAAGTNSGLVSFGPRWDTLVSVAESDGDAVCELSLPDRFRMDLEAHRAHPALLDVAMTLAQSAAGRPMLPFHFEEVVFFRPVPAEVVAHVKRTGAASGAMTCDVAIHDARGREVVRATGFTMRAVDPEAFHRRVAEPADEDSAEVSSLLSVRDGAALLRRAVEASGHAELVVLKAGEPLPGHILLDGREWTAPVSEHPVPVQPTAVHVVGTEPAPDRPETAAVPADDIEGRLRELWEQLIGIADISLDEDFFEVGGNSLAAVQLVALIREAFGVQLSIGVIFELGTIRKLAVELSRYREG